MTFDPIIIEKRLIKALVEENFKEADRFFSALIMIHPSFIKLGRNTQEKVLNEARKYFRSHISQYNNKFIIDADFIENIRDIVREIIDSLEDIKKGTWQPNYGTYDPKLDVIFGPLLFFVIEDYDDWDYWDDAWIYNWDYDWDEDDFYHEYYDYSDESFDDLDYNKNEFQDYDDDFDYDYDDEDEDYDYDDEDEDYDYDDEDEDYEYDDEDEDYDYDEDYDEEDEW